MVIHIFSNKWLEMHNYMIDKIVVALVLILLEIPPLTNNKK